MKIHISLFVYMCAYMCASVSVHTFMCVCTP